MSYPEMVDGPVAMTWTELRPEGLPSHMVIARCVTSIDWEVYEWICDAHDRSTHGHLCEEMSQAIVGAHVHLHRSHRP